MAARGSTGPDFIEALARGLDVIRCFRAYEGGMSLAQVAQATGLPRPTARRILLTLEELGYLHVDEGRFVLTPRVLELGMAYVLSSGLWDTVRPRMEDLVRATGQSCSIAELDGSDIIYVARVAAVPKIMTLAVSVGTRFPAVSTSLGKVLLAGHSDEEVAELLDVPSRSDVIPTWRPDKDEAISVVRDVRVRGWAISDGQLGAGVRSAAAPIRDRDGSTVAAININVNAAEVTLERLTGEMLPLLLQAAGDVSADLSLIRSAPQSEIAVARR